jgi:hypothetical protein
MSSITDTANDAAVASRRSDLIDLIDAAVHYAQKDGMLWSTGYDALRRIAATVGIDADEWSKSQRHLTYVSPNGRRYTAGVVPYAELTDAIKTALGK